MVSEIAAGLKYYGLKKGDPVCVMALNDVRKMFNTGS